MPRLEVSAIRVSGRLMDFYEGHGACLIHPLTLMVLAS
jgi:hypothetical protein